MVAHCLFLDYAYIPIFNHFLTFFVFHSVNLTLITVTSIHNIQKIPKMTRNSETRWKIIKISRQTIPVLKEKETSE